MRIVTTESNNFSRQYGLKKSKSLLELTSVGQATIFSSMEEALKALEAHVNVYTLAKKDYNFPTLTLIDCEDYSPEQVKRWVYLNARAQNPSLSICLDHLKNFRHDMPFKDMKEIVEDVILDSLYWEGKV